MDKLPLTDLERQQNDRILSEHSRLPSRRGMAQDPLPLIGDEVCIKWPLGEKEYGKVVWAELLGNGQLLLHVAGSHRTGQFVKTVNQIRYRNPFAAASWPVRLVAIVWVLLVGYFLILARGISWDVVETRIVAGVVGALFALYVRAEKGDLSLIAWLSWSIVLLLFVVLGVWPMK